MRLGRVVQSPPQKNIKNHELPGRVHKRNCSFSLFFFCFLSAYFYSSVPLLCSCLQGNVLSTAASVVLLSPRRATCCVTSSSIQGRNPSSVTCAATPAAGGTPSPAIYAPTRVSMKSSPALKTVALMVNVGWVEAFTKDMTCSAVHAVRAQGSTGGSPLGVNVVTLFFQYALQKYVLMKFWGVNKHYAYKACSK